ncbi:MAG: hypothetical protein B5M51_00810 [Anaerolinea sp. 4484_236]|nr:MAG: hypothetical protein B5M51_00810 [Anaerolinea sp. 4484_236]
MSLEVELYTRATTHAGLSALIGKRFYPRRIPVNPTYPLVVYRIVGSPTPDTPTHDGAAERSVTAVQMDCFADDSDAARTLGDQVRSAFNCWNKNPVIGYSNMKSRMNGDDLELNKHRDILEFDIEHSW